MNQFFAKRIISALIKKAKKTEAVAREKGEKPLAEEDEKQAVIAEKEKK